MNSRPEEALTVPKRPCEVCGSHDFSFLFEKEACWFWRCSQCRLERIDPQPTSEELANIYGQRYFDAWGLNTDPEHARSLKIATFMDHLSLLGSIRGARLLDCGAAAGFLMEAAVALGAEPYGVELVQYGAHEIKRKFGNDRVFCGPWEEAGFTALHPPCFDIVCMFDFLEHQRNPRMALHKAYKFLEKGGSFLLTTPDAGSASRRFMKSRWLHSKVEHLFYFDRLNLQLLLRDIGFEVVWVQSAWKTISLRFVSLQLAYYPHPVLTPLFRNLGQILPNSVLRRHFRFHLGEMILYATKP